MLSTARARDAKLQFASASDGQTVRAAGGLRRKQRSSPSTRRLLPSGLRARRSRAKKTKERRLRQAPRTQKRHSSTFKSTEEEPSRSKLLFPLHCSLPVRPRLLFFFSSFSPSFPTFSRSFSLFLRLFLLRPLFPTVRATSFRAHPANAPPLLRLFPLAEPYCLLYRPRPPPLLFERAQPSRSDDIRFNFFIFSPLSALRTAVAPGTPVAGHPRAHLRPGPAFTFACGPATPQGVGRGKRDAGVDDG